MVPKKVPSKSFCVQPLFHAAFRQFAWCWEAKEQMEKLKKDAWSGILQVPDIPESMEYAAKWPAEPLENLVVLVMIKIMPFLAKSDGF